MSTSPPKKTSAKSLTLLRWPWWLLSPLTQMHDFHANPVIGSRWLNRCGLHVLRLLLAHGVTRLRWWLLNPLMPAADRDTFHRDGFLVVHDVLTKEEFAALKHEIAGVRGEPRECIQGDTLTHRVPLDQTTLATLPVTRRLLGDPQLTGPMRYAAAKNCLPFFYIQAIRNGVREAAPDPQKNLHSDTFHPSMKAWFFLEDVDSTRGPFTYVPGSNRLSLARLRWEYRRSIVAAGLTDGYSEKGSFRFEAQDLVTLGLPTPQQLEVPANTLVIANTYGIHCRGPAAPGAVRLELWAYSRFNPFNPWPGLGLPWYHRAAEVTLGFWWRHLDRKFARRGQLSSWHPIAPEEFHGR